MERVKFGLTSGVAKHFGAIFVAVMPLVFVANAPAQSTNLAVTVHHAPSLNGDGLIQGSLQQLLGENTTLNGGFTMTGDLLGRCVPDSHERKAAGDLPPVNLVHFRWHGYSLVDALSRINSTSANAARVA